MKKKYKIVVKNGMKDKHGLILGQIDPKTKQIRINASAKPHKDKRELASTIKHEMLHAKHPKMTEKQVYKNSKKTSITPQEQSELLKKLHRHKLNSRIGGLKRKFKMKREESVEPGTFINKLKALNEKQRVALMGMV